MDATLKKILRALSLELRHTLEGSYSEAGTWNAGDLERRLNQIGIWRDRPVKPIGEMPNLSPIDRKARELIDAYLSLRNEAGVNQSDAVAEFIRESAYSWANRLFALRCMEARGIIDPVILQDETYGGRSMVHNRFAQRNTTQCTGEDDGLFPMLSEEFQERSRELPDLFAPESPAVALRPSVAALKSCIALLSGSVPANGGRATDEVFTAPDAFGWAYQYWNAEEKDRVFAMVRNKKGAKIEGSDIIPATQLYTEPYMVKFLVQNSLGATWMMMHPESKISAAWEYYVKDADRASPDKKLVADITFLDPACGSGHFLIEAFDLLYAMYEDEGQQKEPAAICRSILNNNLFGIDIDERAVQITKAVLWMKAAETVFAKTKKPLIGQDLSEFHDHIIATNIMLPKGKDHLDAFLKKHPEDAPLRPALLTVFEGLQNVHELGSLVQIEEPVEKELRVLKEQAKQQKFDPESGEIVEKVNYFRWKHQVIKRLKAHFQDEAQKALPTEAFFSQSAVKGLALFDLLGQRYDVVAANPPYMGSKNIGSLLLKHIQKFYFAGKRDLYSSFIIRCQQLCLKDGRVSLVTQQSWMFLSSFEKLRFNPDFEKKGLTGTNRGLLNSTKIELIIHLGPRAFNEISGEMVNIVLFILSNSIPSTNSKITAVRLTGVIGAKEKANLLKKIKDCKDSNFIYKQYQNIFKTLDTAPLIYWLKPVFFNILAQNEPLGNYSKVLRGLDTGDVPRFIHYAWEVFPSSRWVKYSRGGGYKKWIGYEFYVVDWEFNGARIKSIPKSIIPNEDFYFKNGLTYSRIATGNCGFRFLDNSTIIGCNGPGLFAKDEYLPILGSILNCHFSTYLIRAISQNIVFQVDHICRMPVPNSILNLDNNQIGKYYSYCITLKKKLENDSILISCENKKLSFNNRLLIISRISAILHLLEGEIENLIFEAYNINDQENRKMVSDDTGTPTGWYPFLTNYDTIPSDDEYILRIPSEINTHLTSHKQITLSPEKIERTRKRLRSLYESGAGVNEVIDDVEIPVVNDDEELITIDTHIPIPSETFLEELSQKMEIHPISIYWLLKEGIEKEGWRCIPEEKRYTEDLFTVIVLHLLGHRWPKQIESGEQIPDWADPDGIIPITRGLTYPTLLQQVRDRIAWEFPGRKVNEIEKEFEEVVGMPLGQWLAGEFFKHHISQFRKRPVAWQLSSSPSSAAGGKGKGKGSRREPAFSCLVYYHKIDADILHKIRTQYVGDLINRYGTELRSLEGREKLTEDQATRKVQLGNWIAELNDFSKALHDVADGGFESTVLREIVEKEPLDKWVSRDGNVPHPKSVDEFHAQEKRYDPDINDGVRVNIMPLQKAGLLAADVIAKKDVEKAIADRAEWRAVERRWCREGKLPKCGWWRE